MFLTTICYNLSSLSLAPLVLSQLQRSNILRGCTIWEKNFPRHLLASKTTPCFLHVVPSPELVSLEDDFFCPQCCFSEYGLGSRHHWVKNKIRWNRIKPPTKPPLLSYVKHSPFVRKKMITIMDFMFLSIPYSFQFKGNISVPFRAVAVTATHNEPANGLKLHRVTALEPNKTIMKMHWKLPLQRRIKN